MSRIDDIFARTRAAGRTALMPFVTGGHPSLDVTARVLPALAAAGADIVEIGFPFSDPIADGPVIAASMHAALEAGVTPCAIFDTVKAARDGLDLGLIAMVSFSIVDRHGAESFVAAAADAGFDGLIVPDIDLEAARSVTALAAARDLSFALLVSPTTPPERIDRIVELCRGFVYLLARAGVTGEQDAAPHTGSIVENLRRRTDLPVAVGFGVTTAEHVNAVTTHADAAIVGSALVRRMSEAGDPVAAARGFVAELAGGLARREGST